MSLKDDQEKFANTISDAEYFDQKNDNYMMRKTKSYLFMDDDSRLEFLASQRFPNDPLGVLRYKIMDNGDIKYLNDQGDYVLEFPNLRDYGFFEEKFVPNIVPALNFAADVGGATVGAQKGFQFGQKLPIPNPVAKAITVAGTTAVGGALGALGAGAPARLGRMELIDSFYSLPPEEAAKQWTDLGYSVAFSSIPFGTGTPQTYKFLNKFSGKEDALKYLMTLKGNTDKIMKESAELGIPLTRAEVDLANKKARQIQHYLSRMPTNFQVNDFYDSRAAIVRETVELFADRIGSGKGGDINTRIQEASQFVLDELMRRRVERSGKIYQALKETPGGIQMNDELLNKVIQSIDDEIAGVVRNADGKIVNNIKVSESTIKNLTKFKKMFYEGDDLVTDLMSLDQRRTSEMKALFSKLQNKGTGDAGKIYSIMQDLTAVMDDTVPEYRLARRIYDPNRPSLQTIERTAISKIAKLGTDKQTATALKNLFDPNVSVKSLRNARRVLQTVDPDLFKDIKKEFILQNLDRLSRQNYEKGLPAFQKYMAQSNVMRMMQEMLEPSEYKAWERTIDFMGRAFSIHRGGSDTMLLKSFDEDVTEFAKSGGVKATEGLISIVNFIPRIAQARFGEKITRNIAMRQKEAYTDKMAELILDDGNTKVFDDIFYFFDTKGYQGGQVLLRGGSEAKEAISREEKGFTGELPMIEESQGSLDTDALDVNMFDETDLSPTEITSPTILPDEKDREIAMRQVAGGIGSLV